MEIPAALVLPMNSVLFNGVFMSQPIEKIRDGRKPDCARVRLFVNMVDRTRSIVSFFFIMILCESVCN